MELKLYFEILYRRKWIVVFTLSATMVVVLAGTLLMTPVYASTATLRVAGATTGEVQSAELRYFDTLMNTYITIAVSQPVLEELKQTLGIEQLLGIDITVDAIPQTELLSITAEATTPQMAQAVANGLAQILINRYQQLYVGGANSAQEILLEQLVEAEQEVKQVQAEYEVLLAQQDVDAAHVERVLRTLDFKERTYGMLLDQYENVRLGEIIRTNAITVVEQASLPSDPAKPRRSANLLLGALVGIMGGIGLALLFDNLDTTIYTHKDIENRSTYPILVEIPDWSRASRLSFRRRTLLPNGSLAMDEAFRSLRIRLLSACGTSAPNTVLVTSAEPGEGKSTVVAKLAAAIAQAGSSVVIVDGDLRRPEQHKIWDLQNETGLTSVLTGQVGLDQALQETPIVDVQILTSGPVAQNAIGMLEAEELVALEEKLSGKIHLAEIQVLTSGPLASNATDMLGSPEMDSLIKQLRHRFDFVLFDSPCLLAVADASVLAQSVDCVILLAARGMSKVGALVESQRRLEDIKTEVGGIVFNRSKPSKVYDGYFERHQPTPHLVIRGPEQPDAGVELTSHRDQAATRTHDVIAENPEEHDPERQAQRSAGLPITELTLPDVLEAALKKAGVFTIEHVLDRIDDGGDAALLAISGFGPKGLAALKGALSANGYEIADTGQALGPNEDHVETAPGI